MYGKFPLKYGSNFTVAAADNIPVPVHLKGLCIIYVPDLPAVYGRAIKAAAIDCHFICQNLSYP